MGVMQYEVSAAAEPGKTSLSVCVYIYQPVLRHTVEVVDR